MQSNCWRCEEQSSSRWIKLSWFLAKQSSHGEHEWVRMANLMVTCTLSYMMIAAATKATIAMGPPYLPSANSAATTSSAAITT